MDNSTKLYSIVNITVNDVADKRNKCNNIFFFKGIIKTGTIALLTIC
jgi:hypothetical protein